MMLADLNLDLNSITLEGKGTKYPAETACPGAGKLCQLIRQSEKPGGSIAFSLFLSSLFLSLSQLPAAD